MATQPTIDDAISAVKCWEDYKSTWLESLKAPKQMQPTQEQIEATREIWLEGWFSGRLSK